MRLWIIGNGFDLHHGLKTRYEDYKVFLCHLHACELAKERRKSQSQKSSGTVCGNCCNRSINTDCPVRKFNELPRSGSRGGLWRDLEEACAIDLDRLMDRLKGEWVGGSGRPEDSAAIGLLHGNLGFAKTFTGHEFYEWLCTVEEPLSKENQKRLDVDEGDLFITFNYTRTLQKVYNISDDQIFYVHGNLKDVAEKLENTPQESRSISKSGIARSCLIFGSPKITDASIKDAIDYYVTLQKTSEEQAKALRDYLAQLSRFLRKDVSDGLNRIEKLVIRRCGDQSSLTEVVVAGHSLGKNDSPYFDYLAESFRYVKWRFLFFSRDDLRNALEFCEQHGLHGCYMPWDTADMDFSPCPVDRRIPYPEPCECNE